MLGGYGNSGSYLFDDFGQPRITSYANNDGWFDDTSDGPVMARLVMFSPNVQRLRCIGETLPSLARRVLLHLGVWDAFERQGHRLSGQVPQDIGNGPAFAGAGPLQVFRR